MKYESFCNWYCDNITFDVVDDLILIKRIRRTRAVHDVTRCKAIRTVIIFLITNQLLSLVRRCVFKHINCVDDTDDSASWEDYFLSRTGACRKKKTNEIDFLMWSDERLFVSACGIKKYFCIYRKGVLDVYAKKNVNPAKGKKGREKWLLEFATCVMHICGWGGGFISSLFLISDLIYLMSTVSLNTFHTTLSDMAPTTTTKKCIKF